MPATVPALDDKRLALSVPEAARLLGVHPLTLRAAVARGDIPAVTVGTRILIPRATLDAFLADTAAIAPQASKRRARPARARGAP